MSDIRKKMLKVDKPEENKQYPPADPMLSWYKQYQDSPKKTLSFTFLPDKIIEQFDKKAKELKMNKKELLIHILQKNGFHIPDYNHIYPRQAKKKK